MIRSRRVWRSQNSIWMNNVVRVGRLRVLEVVRRMARGWWTAEASSVSVESSSETTASSASESESSLPNWILKPLELTKSSPRELGPKSRVGLMEKEGVLSLAVVTSWVGVSVAVVVSSDGGAAVVSVSRSSR